MKYSIIFFMMTSISTVPTAFADCAPSWLQHHYDSADYVFHGTLVSKQHDADKPSQTIMTFDTQKVFKGMDSEQVVVEYNESYDQKFRQGLEYIVFAHGSEQPLKVDMCDFEYYAFPTVLNMVSQLDEPDNQFGGILQTNLDQHLTESEKTQLESFSEDFAKERQKERDRLFGQTMLIGIPAAIGIGIVVMWVKTLRSK